MSDQVEFTYSVDLSTLRHEGNSYSLKPQADVLKAIAQRLKIPKVVMLTGAYTLTPQPKGVLLTGIVSASLVRHCVASLEELDEAVEDEFSVEFDRTVSPESADPEHEDFALDGPEYLEGDTIDIGEILIQHLSLAMDPFPRKKGAQSLSEVYGTVEEASPFAILKENIKGD